MEWINFWSAVLGAVIGGLLAGFFSLKATKLAHKQEKDKSANDDKKELKNLLQAIHDEIETVFDRYQETMGAYIESLPKDTPLLMYYPLVSDFFVVYNGNSSSIGRIDNNDLRKKIIMTYTLAKGIIDSYRMNNDLVAKWEYSDKLFSETQNQIHENHAMAAYQRCTEYTVKLKEGHFQIKEEVQFLLRELRKNGVLNEQRN